MKYISLFEQFEEGHKFDLLDIYLMDIEKAKQIFFLEIDKSNPDIENIKVFLDSGFVDVNANGYSGNTLLHWAAHWNSLEAAELFISYGAKIDSTANDGSTPLHFAAFRNSLEVAKLLISNNSELNAKDNNDRTPLHDASRRNRLEVAKLLIQSGADVNAKTNEGETPLDLAQSEEMHDLFVEYGGVNTKYDNTR